MGKTSGTLGFQSIGRPDCVRLIASATLARVVLSVRCLPVALAARVGPVTDVGVLLASHEAAILRAAARHVVVGLQCDGVDENGLTWSVMVSGLAAPGPPDAGAPGAPRCIYVPFTVVTGHRG